VELVPYCQGTDVLSVKCKCFQTLFWEGALCVEAFDTPLKISVLNFLLCAGSMLFIVVSIFSGVSIFFYFQSAFS